MTLYGRAIRADLDLVEDEVYFTERSIPFNALVKLSKVMMRGTPRAVNHEIFVMEKALIENRVREGNIEAVQSLSHGITAKTIQHLIDVSIQVEQMECTAWLLNYKNEHFPIAWEDLELWWTNRNALIKVLKRRCFSSSKRYRGGYGEHGQQACSITIPGRKQA